MQEKHLKRYKKESEVSNKKYTTDGQVITNGESAMGIFSATDYINQLEEKLQEAQE